MKPKPASSAADVAGHAHAGHGRVDDRLGLAHAHVGSQVVAEVHRRVLVLVGDLRWGQARHLRGHRGDRHHVAVARTHVHLIQRRRGGCLRGQGIDHHAVLVDVRIDGGDLALAERTIQRAVDGAHCDAQARGLCAVDLDVLAQAGIVHVGPDVAQLRVLLQFRLQLGQPFLQCGEVVALQRNAVLRALAGTAAIVAGQVWIARRRSCRSG